MKVFGRHKLVKFAKRHAAARSALNAWYFETLEADWKTPQDIKDRYANASVLAGNRVIFNIRGNNYRLAVEVFYSEGAVIVEWVGTHAEYDKKSFEE